VLVTAVGSQDIPVVTGIVVLIAAVYVITNLLVDVLYTVVDPRVRIA
jgi:peptide/nickel transport system permease protein